MDVFSPVQSCRSCESQGSSLYHIPMLASKQSKAVTTCYYSNAPRWIELRRRPWREVGEGKGTAQHALGTEEKVQTSEKEVERRVGDAGIDRHKRRRDRYTCGALLPLLIHADGCDVSIKLVSSLSFPASLILSLLGRRCMHCTCRMHGRSILLPQPSLLASIHSIRGHGAVPCRHGCFQS
jgi:hypothetical protein